MLVQVQQTAQHRIRAASTLSSSSSPPSSNKNVHSEQIILLRSERCDRNRLYVVGDFSVMVRSFECRKKIMLLHCVRVERPRSALPSASAANGMWHVHIFARMRGCRFFEVSSASVHSVHSWRRAVSFSSISRFVWRPLPASRHANNGLINQTPN